MPYNAEIMTDQLNRELQFVLRFIFRSTLVKNHDFSCIVTQISNCHTKRCS